jgi:hypothetical protein
MGMISENVIESSEALSPVQHRFATNMSVEILLHRSDVPTIALTGALGSYAADLRTVM